MACDDDSQVALWIRWIQEWIDDHSVVLERESLEPGSDMMTSLEASGTARPVARIFFLGAQFFYWGGSHYVSVQNCHKYKWCITQNECHKEYRYYNKAPFMNHPLPNISVPHYPAFSQDLLSPSPHSPCLSFTTTSNFNAPPQLSIRNHNPSPFLSLQTGF